MKTEITKLSGVSRRVRVAVPPEVVRSAFQSVLKDVQGRVALKGFRKGKVPVERVKAMYGDLIREDATKRLVERGYIEALVQHQLNPITEPSFEFSAAVENNDFQFSVDFDVRPEIELQKIEGFVFEKPKLQVSDESIQGVLNRIQNSHAEVKSIGDTRTLAALKDLAVIDFEGFKPDGQAINNGKGENFELELGSNSFIPGFEEGVVGMSIGEEKTLALKFPENYHEKSLSGQEVHFKVKLKDLKQKTLKEFNEEFLKSLNFTGTFEEFKESIRKDLESSEEAKIKDEFKNQVLQKLLEANPFDVPEKMVEAERERLVGEFKQRFQQDGFSEADFTEYQERFKDDLTKNARDMVRAAFLMMAIADKNNLHSTDEDMEKRWQEQATSLGMDVERVKSFYKSQEKQLDTLRFRLTEEKVIDFVVSKSTTNEV